MLGPRCIRLRRPAVISRVDEPFVPDGDAGRFAEIDRRWSELRARNPACHDGRISHVLGVHRNGHGGAVIHVAECSFRYRAVQADGFDLGVRGLGVKGITTRGGTVLLGRRATHVFGYPGLWEFAPAGIVEPDEAPATTIMRELAEETGHVPDHDPVPIAILYDDVLGCWEIVFRVAVSGEPRTATTEYSERRWCAPGEWPEDLSPIARRIAALLESQESRVKSQKSESEVRRPP